MGHLPDLNSGAAEGPTGRALSTRAHGNAARVSAVLALSLFLANCTAGPLARLVDPKYGVPASPRVVEEGQPVPKGGGYYRVGNAYTVGGRTYVPEHNPNYRAEGIASWYGRDFHGRITANREIFDMDAISAAHPTLPIPSYARVTNLANRRSIIVRVNDRGPFKEGRIADLSYKAAELLGFHKNGIARVRVEYVGPAPLEGTDDRQLIATLRNDGQPAPAPSAVRVASGGPFAPAAGAPVQGQPAMNVPTPPERPFDLGRYPVASTPPFPPAAAQVASAPIASRASYAGSETTTTFAPVTGRGLY